eukprot:scaffold2857_cov104-Skeletonema_dohrnii-CCMP3373.AAC.4
MAKSSSTKQQKEGGKAAPVKVKAGKTSAAANKKKPKIARPIPKSWPVSSHLSYPPPNSTTTNDDDDDDSTTEQQTSLKPGKTLQQNCNGCDVFLRKSAVQSTSASIIPTKQNSNSKGAVKRFLIVFPGRMTLKAPPAAVPTASAAAVVSKEVASKDETSAADNDIKKDDNATTKEDKPETTAAAKPTKRNPFAPSNPPQLLGRLVSLGGADQKVELQIPFPKDDNTNDDNKPDVRAQNEQQQPQKQMVMSGRAIPLSGKYMVLSFKRTGGKDSIAASSALTPKNKKMGTGSIACKDIFRSVIVLGESQLVDQNGKKKVDVGSSGCGSEDVRVSHYGGSERTVDGGGKNDASNISAAAKRKFKSVTAPTQFKQTHDGDESSVVDSLDSDDEENDDDDNDDIEMKNGSDDEFVPISSKKKRSASASKKRKSSDSNDVETPAARKRTPRRSAAKAAKVKYVDDDSDVDMSDNDSDKSDDDNSGKSPTVTQEIDDDSDVSSVVEEIVPKKKRASVAPASKKRKLSSGSSRNESSCIVIDSDDDDIKTPKLAGKTNGLKKATAYKSAAAKGNAKTVQAAPSSPLKSVSPRRRKKLSPNKPSPKKPVSLDLDDDPFAFL